MSDTSFRDLDASFPLFEASVDEAADYAGVGTCSLCSVPDRPCFHLGIGAALILPCPACGADNGLDADDKAAIACHACEGALEYPASVARKKEPKVCYACLRLGKAALTKDTEFGMISWDETLTGVTDGLPGLAQDQFEAVPHPPEEDEPGDEPEEIWIGVRLPQPMMFELLRTPTYGSWQGERWLFCCRQPMTYVGAWGHEVFERRAADGDGQRLFYEVVTDAPEGSWDVLEQAISAYVFECKQCGKLRAHWDSD